MTGSLPACETPSGWVVHAPAKVNVLLEVTPKRPDGYHGIRTLLCPVRLCDTLLLTPLSGQDGRIDLTVHSRLPSVVSAPVPTDQSNLVTSALRALFDECGVRTNCSVSLTKRIPSQAGLGGGSSDAAAALIAANHAWRLGLSSENLVEIAAQVGSDVPGQLFRHATECQGRGELVTPAPVPAGIPLVIAKPAQGLSTAEVFGNYAPRDDVFYRDKLASLIDSLRHGRLQEAGRLMANHLQSPAERLCSAVVRLLGLLRECGPAACQMTGSGTACFAFFNNHTHAARAAYWLRGRGVSWAIASSTC